MFIYQNLVNLTMLIQDSTIILKSSLDNSILFFISLNNSFFPIKIFKKLIYLLNLSNLLFLFIFFKKSLKEFSVLSELF